jgi:uncharacterized protein
MSFPELFRALLFVALVAAVYACAFGVITRLIRSRATEPLFGCRRDAAILLLASAGIVCFAWAQVEPHRVEVTYVRVPVAGLSTQDRIRIVQISDVHSGSRPRLEESLPGIIARQSPDVIVFTGDALNGPSGLPVFRRLITRLSAIAPTYAVMGNWDIGPGAGLNLFGATGIRELDGGFVDIEVRGQHVRLAGARFGDTLRLQQAVDAARGTTPALVANTPEPAKAEAAAASEAASSESQSPATAATPGPVPVPSPVVVLAHSPDAIAYANGADLLLAGHTHGGQIRLPWYGALITLTGTGKQFESGLHRAGHTWIYTNRGIGVEPLLPVRFLCRPEVTVIDLTGAR